MLPILSNKSSLRCLGQIRSKKPFPDPIMEKIFEKKYFSCEIGHYGKVSYGKHFASIENV